MPTPTITAIPTATLWYDKRSIMLMAHLYRKGMLGQTPTTMASALRQAWAEEKQIARQRLARSTTSERQRTTNMARLQLHAPAHITRGAVHSQRGIPTGRIQGSRH